MPDDLRDPKPVKIRCDACPVMCFIADGKSGACDRYANHAGELVRLDPLTVIQSGAKAVAFLDQGDNAQDWDGDVIQGGRDFVTAVGAGTTYPDYKPAPFIVSQEVEGVDMITVVTEGIFSYCGVKVKIDTDRHIGDERAVVRVDGEAIGHVMTSEYGSKMLSLGGVEHLTGGSKKEGRVTCDALLRLCNREPVEVTIDGGVAMVVEAGKAPIINGVPEKLMRVGCGSATIGMFAKQWHGHVDEVVVVDDHITGVLTEHEAGKGLDMTPSGIRVNGRRSTPGRYFQVADFMVPMVPIGLATGRFGNFMNAELWGRASDAPWATVFPTDPLQIARHPSQLYEMLLEGVLLFLVLWVYSAKPRPAGAVTALFGIGYGCARTFVEFFREPDAHIGYLAGGWLTMGMLLSIPMIILGIAMLVWAYRNDERGVKS